MTAQTPDNKFCTANFIVDANGIGNGATHTTIASAIASASAGDTIFVRPGVYSEDITIKAAVALKSYTQYLQNTQIDGKITANAAGNYFIDGFYLTNSSDTILAASSSAYVYVNNCYMTVTTSPAFSSTGTAGIQVRNTIGDIANVKLFDCAGTGGMSFFNCNFSGTPSTASTVSAGSVSFVGTATPTPVVTSGTGNLNVLQASRMVCANVTAITLGDNGSVNSFIQNSNIGAGTATAIVIGAGKTMLATDIDVQSSNAAAISGAGTIVVGGINYRDTAVNTVTTQLIRSAQFGQITFDGGTNFLGHYSEGSYTPTIIGSTSAGLGTYSVQTGTYQRIGNFARVQGFIVWSAHTGTGNMSASNLPFTAKNTSNLFFPGSVWASNLTYGAGAQLTGYMSPNTNNFALQALTSGSASSNVAVDTTGSFMFSVWYEIQ